ncbi:MAG: DUF2520 domain-containing protein [Polyangiaceae bacterium]|nr:DUF2520 domain-containing protein [Polyangiaceae bacterium]
MKVCIIGKGKLGTLLHATLRRRGVDVRAYPGRGARVPTLAAELIVLAVRDAELAGWAERLAAARAVCAPAVVLHVAGAASPEVLAPLRRVGVKIGQAHPLISVADPRRPPTLSGVYVLVSGDVAARRAGRWLAVQLDGHAWTAARLDRAAYHAAAVLVAGGTVGLLAAAEEVLRGAGVPRSVAPSLLLPLHRSVVENLQALGLTRALTGPVRRGDPGTVAANLAALEGFERAQALYRAAGLAQLPLARALGEARPRAQADVARALRANSRRLNSSAPRTRPGGGPR